MKLTYYLTIKSIYGNYKTLIKEFNDNVHYYKWCRLVISRGHKIIGTTVV